MIILKTLMVLTYGYIAYQYFRYLMDSKLEGFLTGLIIFLTILTIIL